VTGKSGLILDIVIETGNPADAERFLPMLDRHIARCGGPPRQIAADGGYAIRTAHPTMPQFQLDSAQIGDLMAYLKSLAGLIRRGAG
jgi:Transposase DDE domain